MAKVPRIKVTPPGPKAKRIVGKDTKYIATSTKCSPIVAKSAKGAVVEDVDGNLLLDFATGIGVLNTGHCHPTVVKAVQDQAAKMMHFAGTDFYYSAQADLAEMLTKVTPGKFAKKVFFTNSGTEAIEAAIKVTRWSTGRKRFIAFMNAFHGRTMGSLSLTASKPRHQGRFFPTMPGVTHLPFAYCYRCRLGLEYPGCDMMCVRTLEEHYFQTFLPAEEVAACFIEPIQGEGGYVVPPKEYFPLLHKILKRHGILLVDDEVQAGFGRTGKMFAIEHWGVTPEIVTVAKGMASGMPIGACVFDAKYDFGVEGAHSNTYGGNPVASAACMATIEVIQKEKLAQNAAKLGKHLRKRLDEMQSKFEKIGDVRGIGLMQATELVTNRKTKKPAAKYRDKVVEISYKTGLVLLPCGTSGIRYIPPLNISKMELDAGLDVLEKAFRKAE
jgi:4-aminobutyrate aminotransferase